MTTPDDANAPLPDHAVIPRVWSRVTDLEVDRGEGSWLTTRTGERYLDYTSGIGVTNTGHAHPRIAAAIAAQAHKLIHGQQNIVYHAPGLHLHARLARLLPGGPFGAFLANSGAEAIEAAVKLARRATGRPAILVFRGSFHGRTAQAMAMTTAKNVYRGHFEPLPGSVYATAFPYCHRAPDGGREALTLDPARPGSCLDCTCRWQQELEHTFHTLVDPSEVAAVFIEPVLGEGGYVVPPKGFLTRLRAITAPHGILLAVDEIQTGFGRTGRMFAVEHENVSPDILVIGKGIASGLPLAGILARTELLAKWQPGTHGGTYGGNVIACAAALATLDVIADERLCENAAARGEQFLAGLRRLTLGRRAVTEVRGLGLMLALEFAEPAHAKALLAHTLANKLMLLSAGTYGHVVRIVPPLVTTAAEVELALQIIDGALDAVCGRRLP